MSYLPSILLAVVALLLLAALAFRVAGGLRRFRSTLSMVMTSTNDRTGLLRARVAGVRVALAQRRRVPENQ
ncbi:bacteriophage holin [Amycolatopsis sp. K13G38]|uniref:Bacteriophage holin n=1 Tax=Amycolatopsis acididurans TaxID=2724524 RepID=A0ABX1J2P1_9PSEU|nr:bacteriophage holin [Amycolatopsis acididurans]NKQ52546.1 bacteriophage holin [Amycolatopsis acididurans]